MPGRQHARSEAGRWASVVCLCVFCMFDEPSVLLRLCGHDENVMAACLVAWPYQHEIKTYFMICLWHQPCMITFIPLVVLPYQAPDSPLLLCCVVVSGDLTLPVLVHLRSASSCAGFDVAIRATELRFCVLRA